MTPRQSQNWTNRIRWIKTATREQLLRLYGKIYDRYTANDGYQMFGYDWQTLRSTRPIVYRDLHDIWTELQSRHCVVDERGQIISLG